MGKKAQVWLLALAVSLTVSCAGAQVQDRQELIEDVAEALGMLRGPDFNRTLDPISRAFFVGSGNASVLNAEGNWQEYRLISFRQDMGYHIPAIRQHIQYVNAQGNEGKAYLVARENLAWNEESLGMGATAVEGAARDRIRQVSITPHGFWGYVVRANPDDVQIGRQGGKTTVSVMINGERATAILGGDMRPEQISIQFDHPQLGNTELVASYTGYKDFNYYLVFFPSHITHRLGGRTVLDLEISDHHNGGYLVWPVPENLQASTSSTH